MANYTIRILQTGSIEYMNFEERQSLKEEKRQQMQKKSKGNLIDAIKDKYYCSTGVYNLDKALHGGIPFGRLIEYYGLQSSGKTLNAYKAMAQCNRVNYETGEIDDTYENPCSTCLIDLELTSEPAWERKLGYFRDEYGNNVDQANGGDTVHDAVLSMINDDMYSMIVIDSTYRMMPSEILEADYETTDIGRRAKCLSKCCNSWTTALFKSAKRNEGKPWRVPCILLLSHAMPIFMDPYGRMISDAGKKIPYMMTQQVFFSKLKIEESTSSKFGTGKFKGTVKKCKVGGPAGYVAEYNVALSDLENLKQGEVDNVKNIFADIKDLELMQKVKGGYEILGEHYDKQSDFKDRMYSDLTFQANTWKEVIERSKTSGLEFDEQSFEDSKLLDRG